MHPQFHMACLSKIQRFVSTSTILRSVLDTGACFTPYRTVNISQQNKKAAESTLVTASWAIVHTFEKF